MTQQEYKDFSDQYQKQSPLAKDMLLAFLIGGAICCLGQAVHNLYLRFGFNDSDASSWTSITLIFLSILVTGFGWYDKLAKFGGGGTLVPITGFANSVASPALEFKAEGFVTGMAAKLFTVAGPVIVFGTAASVLYGLILVIL